MTRPAWRGLTPEWGAFWLGVILFVIEEALRITLKTEPSPTMIAPALTLVLGAPVATAWRGRRGHDDDDSPLGPPPHA